MLRRFRLEEPESVQEASELLARYGESSVIYAGGTELLLAMKESLVRSDRLINIKKIPDLNQVKLEDGLLRIGALTTHRSLEESTTLQKHFPAFVELERNVANERVREVGTLGGNLCFAEPHSDPGALLLVSGAMFVAEKGSTKREIPIEKFFVDAYENCLEQDEILTEIRMPQPSANSAFRYLKFGYLERPSVGVALFLRSANQGKAIAEAKIAVGSAGPLPKRIEEAEDLLKDKSLDEVSHLIGQAGQVAAQASDVMSDIHGSSDYKEHLIQVLLKRAFQSVLEQWASGNRGEEEAHV